jgi:hypothetical protein
VDLKLSEDQFEGKRDRLVRATSPLRQGELNHAA